jgi:hypothetical protein
MQEQPKEEGPRSFAVVYQTIDEGSAHAEASAGLHKLLKVLQDEANVTSGSASGEITIKLAIKVDARGVAVISPTCIVKEPKKKRAGSTMWITDGGNLTPQNPRQLTMPLREVERPATRELETPTPAVREV